MRAHAVDRAAYAIDRRIELVAIICSVIVGIGQGRIRSAVLLVDIAQAIAVRILIIVQCAVVVAVQQPWIGTREIFSRIRQAVTIVVARTIRHSQAAEVHQLPCIRQTVAI